MTRVRLVVPVSALAAALALSGCGSARTAENTAGPAPTPATSAPSPAGSATSKPAAPERLAFTGKTLDGAAFDAATLAGKPAVLWFWAPWCPKCRAAGPAVAKAAKHHEGKVSMVGVAGLSDDTGSMRDFVADTKTGSLTHLADGAGGIWMRFGVTSQHTYVLISADGTVIHTGALSNNEFAQRVAELAG